ncbi:MAG: molybdenum cofactor guanylyltransferase [Cyanobacteria bacterium P01_D01_bin.73]
MNQAEQNVSILRDPSLNVLILAGGKSRRMGRDKALIQWQGITFLERCAQVALKISDLTAGDLKAGDRCDIVTPWPERYQPTLPPELLKRLHWCCDPQPGAGPPQAIAKLLTSAPATGFSWTLVLACDMPKLDPDLLRTWRSHLGGLSPDTIAYVPRWGDRWEPLCGFYRPQAGPLLQKFLDSGGRSLQSWLNTTPLIQPIPLSPEERTTLHNCNHPADLDSILEADDHKLINILDKYRP